MNVGTLKDGVYHFPVRVYYEDTDAGGIVYYANYLKFAERARTEFLRSVSFQQKELADRDNLLFVVSKVEANYKKPTYLDDVIDIETSITTLSKLSVLFQHDLKVKGILAVTMKVLVVTIDKISGRLQPLPERVTESFKEIFHGEH